MKAGIRIFLFFVSFYCSVDIHCQEGGQQDNQYLKNASYEEISNLVFQAYQDTLRAKSYLRIYIDKAKNEENELRQGEGMAWLARYIPEEKLKLGLLDSAIALTKNKEHESIPIRPYSFKGWYYLMKCDYNRALDNYLIALELSKEKNNTEFEFIIKHNIGVIKGEIGQVAEALDLFRESMNFERLKGDYSSYGYIVSLLYMGEYLIKNKQLDSAKVYLEEGIVKSKVKYDEIYNQYLVQHGILLFRNGQLRLAEKHFADNLLLFADGHPYNRKNNVLAHYYMGKSAELQNLNEIAAQRFKDMDSVSVARGYTTNEIRDGYTFLINHFARNESNDLQLFYIERLLKVDSINAKNGIVISNRLNSEYDTPQLLENRKQLIDKLKSANIKTNKWIIWLGLLLFVVLTLLAFVFRKERKLKRMFNDLILSSKSKSKKDLAEIGKKERFRTPDLRSVNQNGSESKELGSTEVSEEVISIILEGLKLFEEKEEFLDRKINSTRLAKRLNTNVKYLSFVINHIKHKNFSSYIKDLRIDYAIIWLQENEKKRHQLTIEGIAQEMGFNNAESFSLAFKKKTGLNPSYFIKQLSK